MSFSLSLNIENSKTPNSERRKEDIRVDVNTVETSEGKLQNPDS
jgi:hypothetical protein